MKQTVARAILAAGAGAMLIALLAARPASSQAALATVSITPQSQSAKVGDTVKVTIRAEDVTHLGAYEVMLQYDTDILEYSGFSDLGFLGSTGRQVSCPGPVVTTDAGTVQAGCVTSTLEPAGPDGDADLAELSFKALAAGTSDLVFLKVELGDENGDGCCGEFWIDTDPEGELTIHEAAVAVGSTSLPDEPDPPAPSTQRRTQRAPEGAQNPAFETLPDTPQGQDPSDSAPPGSSSGSSGGSTRSGSSVRGNARGTTGGASPGGTGASGAAAGSEDFPVAGYGSHQSEDPAWALALAYGLAAVGVALTAGTIGVEEWRRRRAARR
jgi:hypothetical protein